jgi:hypothetical protein
MTKALFSTQHLLSDLPEKIGKYPVVGTAGRGNMGNETQMEQAQDSVQARFNKVFLKTLVRRLEKTSDELTNQSASQDSSLGDSRENPTDTDAPEMRLS